MATLRTWSSNTDTMAETATGAAATIGSGGSYGERMNWPATTATAWKRWNITSATDHNVRVVYTMPTLPTSSFMVLSAFDGTTNQWRVDFQTSGALRLRNTSTTAADGTVPLVPGTEYVLKVWRSGTTATVKAIRVSDGVTIDTVTGTVGGAAVTGVYTGNNASFTGTLGAFTFDELVVTDQGVEPSTPTLPTAPLTLTGTVTPTSVPQGTSLTVTFTATGGTAPYLYEITDWGDGPIISGTTRSQGSTSPQQSSNVFTKTLSSSAAAGATNISGKVTGS